MFPFVSARFPLFFFSSMASNTLAPHLVSSAHSSSRVASSIPSPSFYGDQELLTCSLPGWQRRFLSLSSCGRRVLCCFLLCLLFAGLTPAIRPAHSPCGLFSGLFLFAKAGGKSRSSSHVPVSSTSGDSGLPTDGFKPPVAAHAAVATSSLSAPSSASTAPSPARSPSPVEGQRDAAGSSSFSSSGLGSPSVTPGTRDSSSSPRSRGSLPAVSRSRDAEKRKSAKQPTNYSATLPARSPSSSSSSRTASVYASRSGTTFSLPPHRSLSTKLGQAASSDQAFTSTSRSISLPSLFSPSSSKGLGNSGASSSPSSSPPGGVASASPASGEAAASSVSDVWSLVKRRVQSGEDSKKGGGSDYEKPRGSHAGQEEKEREGLVDGWSAFIAHLKALRKAQQSSVASLRAPEEEKVSSASFGGGMGRRDWGLSRRSSATRLGRK